MNLGTFLPLSTLAILLSLSAAVSASTSAASSDLADTDAVVARITADLPETLVTQHSAPRSLASRMAAAGVPAVSVAVFRDGRLAWARAWGSRDAKLGGAVDTATLFQAASISKPVAAVGAMVMAQSGRLSLDKDIGEAVRGWVAPVPVTARQLLSHTAGLSVSGFPGYAAGQPVPSALQVLTGEPPANTRPVTVQYPVGQGSRYSGGGYVVLQAWMAALAGEPFSDWMQSAVLAPLAMGRSSFAHPARDARDANVVNIASGHRQGQPLPGRWHTYPELAAAGLWSTPTDLGQVAAELQNSLAGRPTRLPVPALASQMLARQAEGRGVGWVLETLSGEPVFGHLGLNEGFEALLAASANAQGPQQVVVVMTNGQGGTALAQAMLRAVARELGWAAYAPRRVQTVDLPLEQLQALEGAYQGEGRTYAIELVSGVAHLRDGGWQRAPLVPVSTTRFAVGNRRMDLVFSAPDSEGPRELTVERETSVLRLKAVSASLPEDGSTALLLRGGTNSAGKPQVFVREGPQRWGLTLALPAGTAEFKIGSPERETLSLGARFNSPAIATDSPIELVPLGDSLRLAIAQAGRYKFILATRDKQRPQLEVQRLAD